MYRYFICLFMYLLLVSCQPKHKPALPLETQFGPFKISRGTNIAHWLSQSDRRGEERAAFFTHNDIAFIDSVGFDHIRLPIDEEQMWDENGKANEDAFQLLDQALTWCHDIGL